MEEVYQQELDAVTGTEIEAEEEQPDEAKDEKQKEQGSRSAKK